ncbi:MAG: hypothetical protein U0Y82_01235 [Thermoleophilia bacterium]
MPSRLNFAACAAACCLAVAPASAVATVLGLQDDSYAVTPTSQLDARLALTTATGARLARVDVFWSDVAPNKPVNPTDPADPAYDWRALDARITGLANANITPLISVYSSPTWSTGGRFVADTHYNPYAPAPGDYGNFMTALAKRYNGTYIPAVYGITPLPRVRLIEVWNEPDLKRFFRVGNASSLSGYLRLLREAYPAVKAQNPTAIVIAGVGSPNATRGDGNVGSSAWLKGIVASPLSVKFDAYSQHIYPASAPLKRTKAFPSWSSISQILSTLDQRRARQIAAVPKGRARVKASRRPRMKLYITEAGYTTASTPFRKVRVSDAQQARYMRDILRAPQVVANRSRIPAIVWFNLMDNPNWPGGLLRADGSKKAAYATFTSLAGRGVLTPDLQR